MVTAAFSIEADFEHSLEQLWNFVSYVPNQDHWVFGMSDSEVEGGGEIGVGTVIAGTSTEGRRSSRITVIVKEYQPQHRIVWENTDGEIPFLTEITLRGDERSSHMRYEVTLHTQSWLWGLFLGPLRRPLGNMVANKRLRDEIVHLREALQRRN